MESADKSKRNKVTVEIDGQDVESVTVNVLIKPREVTADHAWHSAINKVYRITLPQ